MYIKNLYSKQVCGTQQLFQFDLWINYYQNRANKAANMFSKYY